MYTSLESKDAKIISKALFEEFIMNFGVFKMVQTDLGTEFVIELQKSINKIFHMKRIGLKKHIFLVSVWKKIGIR